VVSMMSWSDPGWVGWTVMTISMLAFWVLIAVGFAALLGAGRGGRAREEGNTAAERLLDERFARGDRRGRLPPTPRAAERAALTQRFGVVRLPPP
jgi:putative membrane protein